MVRVLVSCEVDRWCNGESAGLVCGRSCVRAPASCAVDRGFEPRSGTLKTIKLVCVVSPLSTQH